MAEREAMTRPRFDVVALPSWTRVASEYTDAQLEAALEDGEDESSPGFLLAVLAEWDRRNAPLDAA